MSEMIMVKRKARAGEVGLFVAGEVFEDEFSHIKMDQQVSVKATVEAHAKYLRTSWRIANLVCDASEDFDTPEDARDHILIECRHFKRVHDKLRNKAELKPKPTRTLDGTEWLKLIKRMVHVAVTIYGIPEDEIFRGQHDYRSEPANEPPPHDVAPEGPAEAAQRPDPEPVTKPAPKAPAAPKSGAADPDSIWDEDRLPENSAEYHRYCRARIAQETDGASMLVWWNGDEQWNLRSHLKIGVGDRKLLEKLIEKKFP